MKKLLLLITFLITIIGLPYSNAQAMNGWRDGPYGDYCPMWGSYGARKPVKTSDEAKKILQEYFSKDKVKIGLITEEKWFFRAEIVDKSDVIVDVVIIDKRTGRIRSIY